MKLSKLVLALIGLILSLASFAQAENHSDIPKIQCTQNEVSEAVDNFLKKLTPPTTECDHARYSYKTLDFSYKLIERNCPGQYQKVLNDLSQARYSAWKKVITYCPRAG